MLYPEADIVEESWPQSRESKVCSLVTRSDTLREAGQGAQELLSRPFPYVCMAGQGRNSLPRATSAPSRHRQVRLPGRKVTVP